MPVAVQINEALSDRFSARDGNQSRTLPSLDSGAPQIRITPDLIALARAGVSVREFSMAVDVFNDGACFVMCIGIYITVITYIVSLNNLNELGLRNSPI